MENGVSIQLSWWESILDLLQLNMFSLAGFVIIGILIFWLIKKGSLVASKRRLVLASAGLYYYLLVTLTNVFGIPSLGSLSRLYQMGESFFNPTLEFIPFADGLSFSFLLNILAFIPIGFLVPLISPTFKNVKKTVLFGVLISVIIEVSQLFTLYRATDINDLFTNILGTLIGYYCFTFFNNLFLKGKGTLEPGTKDQTKYLPPSILVVSFLMVFLMN